MTMKSAEKQPPNKVPPKRTDSNSDFASSDSTESPHFFINGSKREPNFIQKQLENDYKRKFDKETKKFRLKDIIPLMAEGAQVIIEDEISQCFASRPASDWNWNVYLFVLWSIGILIRYLVLFPIRLLLLIFGFIIFLSGHFLTLWAPFLSRRAKHLCIRKLVFFISGIFLISWGGVVKYHGKITKKSANQIYVANHSSMIDYIILLQTASFAVLGQIHTGWVGWMQQYVLKPAVGGVWFKRDSAKDRKNCAKIVKDCISTDNFYKNRMLVFPEGTCVGLNYCIQFKKGAFDLGAEVCPIAIKYNQNYTDAFWNSRKKSFARHLFDLMTSWTLACDIYFLEPQQQQEGETVEEFSERVKKLICDVAEIKSTDWNGYWKYFRPSPRFVEYRQRKFSESLAKSRKSIQLSDIKNGQIAPLSEKAKFSNNLANGNHLRKSTSGVCLDQRSTSLKTFSKMKEHSSYSAIKTDISYDDLQIKRFFDSIRKTRRQQRVRVNLS